MPHPIDIHVGMKIRARRRVIGLSQEELGDCMGITYQQVQKYERGLNRIGASSLYLIAQRLDVSVNSFYEGLRANKEPEIKTKYPTSYFNIIRNLQSITCREKLLNISKTVKFLAEKVA